MDLDIATSFDIDPSEFFIANKILLGEAKMTSRKFKTFTLPVFFCITLAMVLLQIPRQSYADEQITIDLAANFLNLSGNISRAEFHTNIRFSRVDCATVTLTVETEDPSSIPVDLCRSDGRGFLVAEFSIEKIEDMDPEIGEENTFVLEGKTKVGESFYGSQEILVVDRSRRDDDDDDDEEDD